MISQDLLAEADKLSLKLIAMFDDDKIEVDVALHAMSLVIARCLTLVPASEMEHHIKTMARNVRVSTIMYAAQESKRKRGLQ